MGSNHIALRTAHLALYVVVAVHAKKIVTIGDSWAEYSGNGFSDFCDGATQINRGIGGTRAAQWIKGEGETSFKKALAAAGPLGKDDVVVFSLGGNDFIPGCTKPLATLTKEIKDTMHALGKALGKCGNNCPKIVTFGYPKSCNSPEKECPTQASLAPLSVALAAAAKAVNVEYVATEYLTGGTATSYAPTDSFGMCFKGTGKGYGVPCMMDCIHLNQQGYCKVITSTAVQKALGCKVKTYDCSKVSKDLDRKIRWPAKCPSFPCKGAPTAPPPPSAPSASSSCKDDDAGVKAASSGAFQSCAALMQTEYNCQHIEHGATIRKLCAASCKCDSKCCAQSLVQTSMMLSEPGGDTWTEDSEAAEQTEDTWVEAKP